jgi:hypothetical protein
MLLHHIQIRINCLVEKYRINTAKECIEKAQKASREFQEALFSSIQKVRRGRRCKQLLDDLRENRKCWDMKGEALDSSHWNIGCGRRCGSDARRRDELMKGVKGF